MCLILIGQFLHYLLLFEVIRSLKKALQPSVTNLRVEYKLPLGFEVTQVPSTAPVLYSGEKAVVYGILKKSSELMSPVECTASLNGQIMDALLECTIPFEVPGNSPSFPIPIIHHLAAKALIKDWERDGGNKKSDIVKLSIESSVVSSHTAFVAIDESNQVVKGAMNTWDITAKTTGVKADGRRSGRTRQTARKSTGGKAPRRKLIQHSTLSAAPYEMEEKASSDNKSSSESEGESGPDCSCPSTSDSLSGLISLQQADGSWKWDDVIAKFLSKSLKELSDACPVICDKELAALWVTILCVVCLELKHPSQKDEWELIAMKAELWLHGQSLPIGADLKTMKESAKKVIAP